jgi:hypothetical protein
MLYSPRWAWTLGASTSYPPSYTSRIFLLLPILVIGYLAILNLLGFATSKTCASSVQFRVIFLSEPSPEITNTDAIMYAGS